MFRGPTEGYGKVNTNKMLSPTYSDRNSNTVSNKGLLDYPQILDNPFANTSLPCPPTEREDWKHLCLQFAFRGWRHPYANMEPTGNALTAIVSSIDKQLDLLLLHTRNVSPSARLYHIRMIMEKLGTIVSHRYPPQLKERAKPTKANA